MASVGRSASVFWQNGDESGTCKIIESKSASDNGNIANGCREEKLFPTLILSKCHGPGCHHKLLILKK